MKRLLMIIPLAILLFAGCTEEDIVSSTFLEDTWVEVSNAKDGAIILDFYNDGFLEVDNATIKDYPFCHCTEWEYYLTADSTLVISYESYDGDDYYTQYYDLELSTGDNLNTLYLTYYRNRNNIYHYTFMRR